MNISRISKNLLLIIGPGLLVAATGVGAGDLAGGAFAGSKLGVAVLWAVLIGAFLKFVVTEGLTRWQLATGKTLLEGAIIHLGRPLQITFLVYLVIWSFYVGSALISACGVAASAILPIFEPVTGKIVFGILHSLAGMTLVLLGTYRLFERIMSVGIILMFFTVIYTAVRICSDWTSVIRGTFLPSIPRYLGESGSNQGPVWTLALIGGVGGTLTILCYGYWIRERSRTGKKDLRVSRIDLGVAYTLTALFGIAMVIIASQSNLDRQSSARMVVVLADQLQSSIGGTGRFIFLCGAWAAVFSSLLGVWQSVPYLFADFWQLRKTANKSTNQSRISQTVNTKAPAYRIYLLAITFIPMLGLKYRFVAMQKIYAVLGSMVIPLLALILLILNGRSKWVGREFRNRPVTVAILIATMVLFLYLGLPNIF